MTRVKRGVIATDFIAVQMIAAAAAALSDGEELGPANWTEAQGLLPEEILDHYRLGEYRNRVLDVSEPRSRARSASSRQMPRSTAAAP